MVFAANASLVEIKTLAKPAKHPFIARLYDAGALCRRNTVLVRNGVCRRGYGLPNFAVRGNARSTNACSFISRKVCEAVQYAHGQEIIHRDLEAFQHSGRGGWNATVLLDFGIAKELQSPDA